jgi:putative SOS response-associated peptidase YedK
MCGRFVAASPPADIAAYFDVQQVAETALEPNYNVAPTEDVYVVYTDGGVRRLDPLHWGFVPSWAKDLSVGNRMINARAESVATKGAFKSSFAKRRCIVPADGFYEWKAVPGRRKKQPYFVHPPEGEMFALGGLWTQWKGTDASGQRVVVRSTTIITGEPNEKMAEIHDRMPLILPPSAWDEWLDPDQQDLDALGKLLVPAPPEVITLRPVSTEVNNVRNQGAHLVDEVDPEAAQEDGTA